MENNIAKIVTDKASALGIKLNQSVTLLKQAAKCMTNRIICFRITMFNTDYLYQLT
jgi:hypothetical protein